jgi:hypothetical protein
MKTEPSILDTHLDTLRLPFTKEHCQAQAATAAKNCPATIKNPLNDN